MRRKADLITEAEGIGLVDMDSLSTDQIMDGLRDYYCLGKDILPQIAPMLCKDAKDYLDFSLEKPWLSPTLQRIFLGNNDWIAEEKLDGCRMKMHITPKGIRLDSRRRSDVDYTYKERTENFPQFTDIDVKNLPDWMIGLVLDGEILMPMKSMDTGAVVTDGVLSSTIVICNSSPEVSIPLQQKYGWAKFYVFDICDERAGFHSDRHGLVCKVRNVFDGLNYSPYKSCFCMPMRCMGSKTVFFEQIVNNGGEGIVLKNINARYEPGKRSYGMYKLKKFFAVDVFVTGYLPGRHGNTGLVGSLCVSIMKDGKAVEIGAVSAFAGDLRRHMTADDGSLKDEYYGRVIKCYYQELTKTGRCRHMIISEWKPNKTMYDCTSFGFLLGVGY
ncbi:MAG TPA: hypothetical protein ENH82_19805 [bacterium]|nr:hypothetical protein [bacterium]